MTNEQRPSLSRPASASIASRQPSSAHSRASRAAGSEPLGQDGGLEPLVVPRFPPLEGFAVVRDHHGLDRRHDDPPTVLGNDPLFGKQAVFRIIAGRDGDLGRDEPRRSRHEGVVAHERDGR